MSSAVIQVRGTPSMAAGGCSTTWKPFKDITKYDELHGSLPSKCFTPPHFIHNKQVLVMSVCGVCLCLLVSHTLDGFSEIRKYVCVVTSETGAFRFWNLFTLKGVTLTSHSVNWLHWISLAQVIIMWPTFQCVAVQELSQDQLGKPSNADREHFENSKRKIRPRLETGENPLTAAFVLHPQYFWICLHRLLFLLDTKSYFSFL